MRDYSGVVWTRISGEPTKMGDCFYSGHESRFSYDQAFLAAGRPGLSLLYDPERIGRSPLVYRGRGTMGLVPRLYSLIPPAGANVIRALGLEYLRKKGVVFADEQDENWGLLTLTGHGGIGHVDFFSDDESARRWYGHGKGEWWHIDEQFSRSVKHVIEWSSNEDDFDYLNNVLGPTPTLGGALPKLPLAMPKAGWNGMLSHPRKGLPGEDNKTDIILKFETSRYPGLVALEALCLKLHRLSGFNVPRYWELDIEGIPVLAIERFDRDVAGLPIPMESIFSLLGGAGKVDTPTEGRLEMIGEM